jgi:hypothetical protein
VSTTRLRKLAASVSGGASNTNAGQTVLCPASYGSLQSQQRNSAEVESMDSVNWGPQYQSQVGAQNLRYQPSYGQSENRAPTSRNADNIVHYNSAESSRRG